MDAARPKLAKPPAYKPPPRPAAPKPGPEPDQADGDEPAPAPAQPKPEPAQPAPAAAPAPAASAQPAASDQPKPAPVAAPAAPQPEPQPAQQQMQKPSPRFQQFAEAAKQIPMTGDVVHTSGIKAFGERPPSSGDVTGVMTWGERRRLSKVEPVSRSGYLADFAHQHRDEPRFSGRVATDRWGVNHFGDPTYNFDTANGGRYRVAVQDSTAIRGAPAKEVMFTDADNRFGVTGAGGAHEVFSKVVPAVAALVTHKNYPLVKFTAAEKSRQRLYDRLVRTVAATVPGYAAVAYTHEGTRTYALVRRDQLAKYLPVLEDAARLHGQGRELETLVKAYEPGGGGARVLPAATEADLHEWQHPEGWSDGPPKAAKTAQPERLPPDATPADVARAVLHLRARGKHAAADWLASHLPPSDPFAHLNAPPQPLPPNGPSPEAEGGEGGVAPAVSPMPAQVPHPPNPEGAGSLPPRFTKAHDGPHKFGCVFLLIPEPLRSRVLRMGRMIPDEDLADDGREDNPHCTSLFGLHDSDPVPVFEVLSHFRPVHVTLGSVSCFTGAEYDVVKIDVESDALHRLNAKLRQLPHTNSYKDFVPHVTIAYVKSGTGKLYAERLGSLDERCVCDTAVFSDAGKTRHVYPLGRFASGSVAKAMSYLGGASGGTLVGPAAMGAGKPRRLKRNRRTQRRILKALGEIGGNTSFLTDFDLGAVDAEELAFGEKAFDPAQPRDEVGQWAKLQAGAASRTADLGDVEARLRAAHLARAEELERAADDGERSVEEGLAMGLREDHPGITLARAHVPLLRRLARERRALAAGRVPHVAKGLEADEFAADADDMVAWYTKSSDPDNPYSPFDGDLDESALSPSPTVP